MAPFGKVHGAIHGAADRVKSGLAWANHKYQQGAGLAGRINDLYHVGKKVAGLMMPVLDQMHPGLAPHINAGLGALDRIRDGAVQRHDDVLSKIKDNSDVVARMREAQGMMQPHFT